MTAEQKVWKWYDHVLMVELPTKKAVDEVVRLIEDYQDGECNIGYGNKKNATDRKPR